MKSDSLSSALLAASEQVQLAYHAALAIGDRDLAQSLHAMGWTIASALARRTRQLVAEVQS